MLIAAIIVGGFTLSLAVSGEWAAVPVWGGVALALFVQSRKPPKRHRKVREQEEDPE